MPAPSKSTETARDPDSYTMSLEDARRVQWLRSLPRPLGELYDEGYLTTARLEWAVARAYNPRLKRAALVLLKQAEAKPGPAAGEKPASELPGVTLPPGLTLEQARRTPWPLPPFKGQPMGALVDAQQLSLKNLGFAAESAWDERVRQAAAALLLLRLDQKIREPAPSVGHVRVISGGRSFSEKKQLQIALVQGNLMGLVLGVILAFFILFLLARYLSIQLITTIVALDKSPLSLPSLIGLAVMLGLALLLYIILDGSIKRMDIQIEAYRRGQEGEDRVAETILQTLDGDWSLFRNLHLPGRSKADLDAVLVGPSGVWALEVKNFSGIYRNAGEQWEYRLDNKWKPLGKSPSRQAHDNAARLGRFLKADGIKQWVEAAVVWANLENPLLVENPSVLVWPLDRLPDEIGNLWQEEKLAPDVRARIVEKLTKLCEKQV
jgi:hypothetical protein